MLCVAKTKNARCYGSPERDHLTLNCGSSEGSHQIFEKKLHLSQLSSDEWLEMIQVKMIYQLAITITCCVQTSIIFQWHITITIYLVLLSVN